MENLSSSIDTIAEAQDSLGALIGEFSSQGA
jgi:hypothetical protein